MKAIYATQNGVQVREIPIPSVGVGEILVRVVRSLISSGTERYYIAKAAREGGELQLGYCIAGIVEAIGTSAIGFAVGDRVAAVGWQYAVHAEFVKIPVRYSVKLPLGTSFDCAAFVPLAATALHMINRARSADEEAMLVVGAGVVGQMAIQLLAASGKAVFAVDALRFRCGTALTGGARGAILADDGNFAEEVLRQTDGKGVATAFLCIHGDGSQATVETIRCLGLASDGNRQGTIVCVGRMHLDLEVSAELGNIDVRIASRCGLGYRNDRWAHGLLDCYPSTGEKTVLDNMTNCLEAINLGHLKPKLIHTHTFDISEATSAYSMLEDSESALAIVFRYDKTA